MRRKKERKYIQCNCLWTDKTPFSILEFQNYDDVLQTFNEDVLSTRDEMKKNAYINLYIMTSNITTKISSSTGVVC